MNDAQKISDPASRPHTAMILAAGEGRRMRPLTDTLPKPLLQLCGKPLIDHVLATLVEFGVERIVVNLHHLGAPIRQHLGAFRDAEIIFSDESEELLNSGGGILKALPLLGDIPFFVMNGDAPVFSFGRDILQTLVERFAEMEADALLLLQRRDCIREFDGPGDYQMSADGRLRRRPNSQPADFVFTGTQLLSPGLFERAPAGPFSSVELFDRAELAGRLYGLEHSGQWFQINTPDGLAAANRAFEQ